MMSSIKLSQQMKRHAIIITLKTGRRDLEIAHFLKVSQSFVVKVRKKPEDADRDSTAVAKCKTC